VPQVRVGACDEAADPNAAEANTASAAELDRARVVEDRGLEER
jgi:hypothetical protein